MKDSAHQLWFGNTYAGIEKANEEMDEAIEQIIREEDEACDD